MTKTICLIETYPIPSIRIFIRINKLQNEMDMYIKLILFFYNFFNIKLILHSDHEK